MQRDQYAREVYGKSLAGLTLVLADNSGEDCRNFAIFAGLFSKRVTMKKSLLLAFLTLGLLMACTAEKKPGQEKEPEKDNKETTQTPICPDGAVDLGLVLTRKDGTSYKLYWAQSNLSEEGLCPHPEDYGDYFAWGETEPHYAKGHSQDSPTCNDWRVIDGKTMKGYDWSSYKWCNGRYDRLTKYCPANETGLWGGTDTPDNMTELMTGPAGDDVASKKLGGKWHIPTYAEWMALLTKCTWTWTDSYDGTGVAGSIVTSNVPGYTDKNIFLPAAGGWSNIVLNDAGSAGAYGSSSLYMDAPDSAWYVVNESSFFDLFFCGRCYGLTIRPVSE